MLPVYEVFALKYAQHQRTARANFIGGDPHDGPMPMDYFVWLVRGAAGTWLVDTGFGQAAADARGRELLRTPAQALLALDVAPQDVRDVIITHMHYDHAGNLELFPSARFHLQDREMQYATGRYMAHRCMHEAYSVFDVVRMVHNAFEGRVQFHDGDAQLAPGITLHLVGGHTMGLQAVRVHTRRGWVVLASDASHYWRNIEEERPFPIVWNVGEMANGWERLRGLADSEDHLVPGHDPEVLRRFPPPRPELQGIVASLHEAPLR